MKADNNRGLIDALRGVQSMPVQESYSEQEQKAVQLFNAVQVNEKAIKDALDRLAELEQQKADALDVMKKNEKIRAQNVLDGTTNKTEEIKHNPNELKVLIGGIKERTEEMRREQEKLNGAFRAVFFEIGKAESAELKSRFRVLADQLIEVHKDLCGWDSLLGFEKVVSNGFRHGLHITGEPDKNSPLYTSKLINYKPMLVSSGNHLSPEFEKRGREIKKELVDKIGCWGLDNRSIP